MSDNASATTFRPGDRVRTVAATVGNIAEIVDAGPYTVRVSSYRNPEFWFMPSELTASVRMSAPARALLAAWHASDRTLERIDRPNSSNRANINWGRAVRRYCTPDRSIDMTIAVEVE